MKSPTRGKKQTKRAASPPVATPAAPAPVAASASVPPPSEPAREPAPRSDVVQEVRFAVVMYGGVSLAIYINGVAQELLEMVRASAMQGGEPAHKTVSRSGAIYRRIARYLGADNPDPALLQNDDDAPIRTRFVVDVLSGTSAGGLNAMFLAKALANDQDMLGLKKLWMDEGDIARLLNDKQSVAGERTLDANKINKPESLLNSERMYDKLLTALHAMDFPGGDATTDALAKPAGSDRSPLVEELDLFITTTDLTGLPIHLKLANTVADEMRHRNVFPFRYSTEDATGEARNDFLSTFNPFLAFAGRCTSSFPFAFEPMQLRDIWPVLGKWERYRQSKQDHAPEWAKRFYEDYVKAGCGDDFELRPFGDGGYLDNKPFTYATRTLMRRRAALPVVRKLLYVEPSPETIGRAKCEEKKPNVLANIGAALVSLPTYETIREDLQAVLERNKLLDQVSKLTEKLDDDIKNRPAASEEGEDYKKTPLSKLIPRFGISYGVYHRLKIDTVTETLAGMMTRAIGFDPASDDCHAIRMIFEAWREKRYVAEGTPPADGEWPQLESAFLLDFDIEYRMRRLYFIERRINELSRKQARSELADFVGRSDFQDTLRKLKDVASAALRELRVTLRTLHRDTQLVSLLQKVVGNPNTSGDARAALQRTLIEVLRDSKKEVARKIAEDHLTEIDTVAVYVLVSLSEVFIRIAAKIWIELFAPLLDENASDGERAARSEVVRLYREFEWYDMVIFPIEHGTDAGETNHVDIVRISPPDAEGLIKKTSDRKKLAGTALWNFGAFLARFWRANDMLWGRLDGAEILIRSLLAGSALDQKAIDDVVKDAHRGILNEDLTPEMRGEIYKMLHDAFIENCGGACSEEAVRTMIRKMDSLSERLKKVLLNCLDEQGLFDYYKDQYVVSRKLNAADQVRVAARAARITGKILERLSANTAIKPQGQLIAKLTASFWALVEISVPGSILRLGARHIGALLYFMSIVLLAVGFVWQPAFAAGAIVFGATVTIHVLSFWLHSLMRGKNVGQWIALGLLLVMAALAAWGSYDLFTRWEKWHQPASVGARP